MELRVLSIGLTSVDFAYYDYAFSSFCKPYLSLWCPLPDALGGPKDGINKTPYQRGFEGCRDAGI
jgi:hypothetical protein